MTRPTPPASAPAPRRWRLALCGLCSLLGLSGLVGCGGGGSAAADLPAFAPQSVAVGNTASSLPAGWDKGVFMQVFVRAYQDSNGDGQGDLQGLIQRLDYLQALGVQGIWLMPIHPSQDGDHGYAVTDYRRIAPEYGSDADFDTLILEAHRRGIGVVLDYLINHSAATHPAFVQSASGRSNPWRDWYVWRDTAPAGWRIYGSNPWHSTTNGAYFAGFWSQMPDFNLRNPAVLSWHQDNLRYWLNRGVDGFRFDAVGNLVENGPDAWENQPENVGVMQALATTIAAYDQRFMVCEAPAQPRLYAGSAACGNAFAFGYQTHLAGATRGQASDVAALADFWHSAPQGLVGFASNHDAFAGQRLADQLDGDPVRLRLAAATYLLQTPSPFIYYGEETGLRGATGLSGDPRLRTPMAWDAAAPAAGFSTGQPFRELAANAATASVSRQGADPDSLLNYYRRVIALRRQLPALAQGSYLNGQAEGALLSFQRDWRGQRVAVVINYGLSATQTTLEGLPASAPFALQGLNVTGDLYSSDSRGALTLSVPGQSVMVLSSGTPTP